MRSPSPGPAMPTHLASVNEPRPAISRQRVDREPIVGPRRTARQLTGLTASGGPGGGTRHAVDRAQGPACRPAVDDRSADGQEMTTTREPRRTPCESD